MNEQFHLPNICTVQSIMFAVLVGALLSVVFALVGGKGLRHFDWQHFALISFFVLWTVILSMALLCRLRPSLARLSLVQGAVTSYVIVLGVTLLISLLAQWILITYLGKWQGFDILLTIEHVLIAAILAGVSLRYLYLQEQLHVQRQAELASRIQALQSRIRPHFLFNSMNIIASLIETQPELAERVVEDLSELFRAALSDASELVPLRQEIELAKNYIHIEELRLGDRLGIDWQLGDVDEKAVVPHLSLQPLLENAIYHGIQPLPEGGRITVSIRQQGQTIHVLIRNPVIAGYTGNEAQLNGHRGNNLALENFQRRLQAYYGGAAEFRAGKFSDNQADYFEAGFSCPLTPVAQIPA